MLASNLLSEKKKNFWTFVLHVYYCLACYELWGTFDSYYNIWVWSELRVCWGALTCQKPLCLTDFFSFFIFTNLTIRSKKRKSASCRSRNTADSTSCFSARYVCWVLIFSCAAFNNSRRSRATSYPGASTRKWVLLSPSCSGIGGLKVLTPQPSVECLIATDTRCWYWFLDFKACVGQWDHGSLLPCFVCPSEFTQLSDRLLTSFPGKFTNVYSVCRSGYWTVTKEVPSLEPDSRRICWGGYEFQRCWSKFFFSVHSFPL